MKSILPLMLLAMLVACKSTGKIKDDKQAATPIQREGMVIEGFLSPTSILLTQEFFFVSNLGYTDDQMTPDEDGFISRVNYRGEVESPKFITGLNAPKGMIDIDGVLYVTDIDEVKTFSLETGEPLGSIDFKGFQAANLADITLKSNNLLWVTDAGNHAIFTLNPHTQEIALLGGFEMVLGVYSIYHDPITHFTAISGQGDIGMGNGQVGYILPADEPDIEVGPIEVLTSPLGQFQGACMYKNKFFIFSDVGVNEAGKIRYYNLESKQTWLFNTVNRLSSPSDFALDIEENCLWIPDIKTGKVFQEFITFQ